MDAEWKRKWVEALRSGEYKQGRYQLMEDNGSFCCLGVLTDLVVKESGGKYSWDEDTGFIYDQGVLPGEVPNVVGLDSYDPYAEGHTLSSWNDDRGADFNRIADIIEKHL